MRARHAYAEAENAQAELRFARERGDVPETSVDNGRLRTELAAALERAQAAEQMGAALRAELVLVKKGVDTDSEPDAENGFVRRRGRRRQPPDTVEPCGGEQARHRRRRHASVALSHPTVRFTTCAEPS